MPEILETRWYPHDLRLDADMVVIGDVHGVSDAFESLLDRIDPGRRLIQLGDLIDRGPNSLGAMRLAQDRILDSGGVVLPGNHEGLMLEAFAFIDNPEAYERPGLGYHHFDDPIDAWVSNGGGTVLKEVDPNEEVDRVEAVRLVRAALPEGYEATLRTAASHTRCGDVLIVHGGLHPKSEDPNGWLAQPLTLDAANASHPHFDHWAWARSDFLSWDLGWEKFGAKAVVHGHTPPHRRAYADASELSVHLDKLGSFERLCVDGGSHSNGTVAMLEMRDGQYRFVAAVGDR